MKSTGQQITNRMRLFNVLLSEKIGETSMIEKIGEEKYQDLTNEIFGLMANITLPVKRGTSIEFRNQFSLLRYGYPTHNPPQLVLYEIKW